MTFAGQFSLPDGTQFAVTAVLTGEVPVGVQPGTISLTGGAVIVEINPGPINFELGIFSVTGTLTPPTPATPSSAGNPDYTFSFVLVAPGPVQRTSLTPGTSFNAVFVSPGPIQFVATLPTGLGGSGSGFVTINPGPIT